ERRRREERRHALPEPNLVRLCNRFTVSNCSRSLSQTHDDSPTRRAVSEVSHVTKAGSLRHQALGKGVQFVCIEMIGTARSRRLSPLRKGAQQQINLVFV